MANVRNTVAYFKEESVVGTAVTPTSATDGFLSIEKPDITTGQREVLNSELLSSGIGMRKGQLGVETAECSIVTELRSHGDASNPTEPDFGLLLESGIGAPHISTAEAVQAAPAPSTTEFGIATEGNIEKYDLMIIDNATDGRVARFVKQMKVDVVAATNDKIDINEDAGGELTATLTPGTYIHGGSSVTGSIGEQIKTQLEVVGAGTYTVIAEEQSDGSYIYSYSASGLTSLSYLIASGTNTATNFMKLNNGFGAVDLSGALSYTAANAVWGNRVVCHVAMTSAPTAADVVSASVNYKPQASDHKHFTSGFYNGNSSTDGYFEQVIGCLVNSIETTIESGAIAKLNFGIQGLSSDRIATTASSYNPTYESVQGLVGFNVEAYMDSTQVCAQSFSVSLATEVSEKMTFCPASGKSGSIIRSRGVTGTINPYSDGSVTYYDGLNANTDYQFAIIIGVKDSGGFIVGKTVGFFLPQININQDKTSDIDDSIIEDIAFSAHTGINGNSTDFVASFG